MKMKNIYPLLAILLLPPSHATATDHETTKDGVIIRLKRAWDRLDILYEETESLFKRSVASKEICELRNMINVGYLIMRQAMERKESRGLHYTIDYPHAKQ